MKFEKKHYIFILFALLISVVALSQEVTTVNEILGNYTELNTSRIFRIYDNSLNEILLSEDALYLSHVNGGINEIKISSTYTQFSKQIDMLGNDIINCDNCASKIDLNEKLNLTGGEITGNIEQVGDIKLAGNLEIRNETDEGILGNFDFYESQNNTAMARFLAGRGYYKPTNSILFGKYGNHTVGYTFQVRAQNMTNPANSKGLVLRYFPNGSTTATTYLTSNEENTTLSLGNLTIISHKSSGSGYEYICVEKSTGKYINSSIACDLI